MIPPTRWWCMPMNSVLGRLKEEDHKVVSCLSNFVRSCGKIINAKG